MDGAGVVRAVIVVALDLGQLVRAVLETPLPRGASMMLVDANGVILGRVPEGEGWSGELVDEPLRRLLAERPAGMHEGVGLDGAPTLFLVEPLLRETSRAWDAAVVIALPRQAVFRAADRLFMLQLAGLGVLALGGVIVIGMLVDRLFGGPAYGLLRVVRSLNAGDVRARMRRTDGTGVIGRLSRSVNALALRMEEHQHAAAALEDQLRNERAARLVETLPPPPPPTAAARPEGSRTPTYSVEPVLEEPVAETADGVPSEEEAYWGLRETAFENAPNPRFLWLSPAHSDALVRLSYALRQRRGCAVLTGEPGCGKTLLTRAVVQRLEPDRYEVGLLTNPHGGRVDLLREVLYELGVETGESDRAELQHQLHDLIARNFQAGRETVLIVDDAQQADNPEWFEELSALLNIQTNERALVTILLAGTPDLIPKVHAVRHLDRRVSIRCQLEPLTEEQTAQYLRYRLSVAGCRDEIFTPDAVSAIHQATQGIPRQINDLGDSAMMWARLHQARPVDAEVVQRVLSAPVSVRLSRRRQQLRAMQTVFEAFMATAEAAPDHAFLAVPPAPGRAYHPDGVELTYGQVRADVLRYRDALRGRRVRARAPRRAAPRESARVLPALPRAERARRRASCRSIPTTGTTRCSTRWTTPRPIWWCRSPVASPISRRWGVSGPGLSR